MNFKAELKSFGALDIVRSLVSSSYICYTNFANTNWFISITDGINVWRTGLLEDDIKKFKSSLIELSAGLKEGDLKVSSTGEQLSLSISCRQESINLQLNELSENDENRDEIKTLLFRLMSSVDSLHDELKNSKKSLEDLKKSSSQLYTDLSGVSSNTKATAKPVKPAGHSIINPSAKRRKAAGGVVFGESEEND